MVAKENTFALGKTLFQYIPVQRHVTLMGLNGTNSDKLGYRFAWGLLRPSEPG